MTTRTRTRSPESKGDAAPDAEQTTSTPPEFGAEQPADEAQAARGRLHDDVGQPEPTDGERALTEVERLRKDLADSVGTVRANHDRHTELCKRLDALAQRLGEIDAREVPAPDLDELHTRFDVLSAEIGALVLPSASAGVAPGTAAPDVLGKVLLLMRAVTEIGKGGTAAREMGGYAFRRVDDAIDAVGNAMRDVGLVLRSEVVRFESDERQVGTKKGRGVRAVMRYVFVSPVDGSEHAVEGIGEGADVGDKATSKASSMALKYALLQGLMIPVVGVHLDSESEDTRPADPPREQQRQPEQRQGNPDGNPIDAAHDRAQGQQQGQGTSTEDPEVRAREVLRRANDGRPADAIRSLLGKASEAGLAGVEVDLHGHVATLQQHMLATIRLAGKS